MAATIGQLGLQITASNTASKELQRLASDMQRVEKQANSQKGFGQFVNNFNRDAATIATGFIGAQAAMKAFQGGLSGTIGAAIDFESSFAGIRKTVDATEEEFDTLAKANRKMSRELPLAVNEINRIGELAGQLGISGAGNIVKFERTIADLANTTNLTADSAATAFAQIANVMELPIDQIDRAGAALVDLGNKSAATEADIVEFAKRIAGAGKIAGLSVAEVEGIGAAFASVGVEAEAGGTAIQKVLTEITKAAAGSGDSLEIFAETLGITSAEFQKLAKENPAEAFTQFVEALGKAGDKAFDILDKLELGDQRLIRGFLSAAGAGDLLRRSIETGNEAFAENTALTAEAEKRYSTTAAQLQILKNNITDVGISIGNTILPALNSSAEGATALLNAVKPVAPAFEQLARAAPIAAAGLAAFAVASRAAQGAIFVAEVNTLGKQFPNLTRQMAGASSGAGLFSNAMRGVGAAVMSPVGALVAFTVAVAALDFGLKKFTGEGILETLSDADEKADRAAKSMERFGDTAERVARQISAGTNPAVALGDAVRKIGVDFEATGDEAREALKVFEDLGIELDEVPASKLAEVSKDAAAGQKVLVEQLTATLTQADDAASAYETISEELVQMHREGTISQETFNLLSRELTAAASKADIFAHSGHELANEQRELQNAMRDSVEPTVEYAEGLAGAAKFADALAQANTDLEATVKAVADAFSQRTLGEITLDRQIADVNVLIARYEAAGTSVPADLLKIRDQLVANQDAAETTTRAAVLRFEEFAKTIRDAGGDVTGLTDLINGLPEEKRTAFIADVSQFLGSAAEVERFIDLVNKNPQLNLEVALKIAGRFDEVRDFVESQPSVSRNDRNLGFAEGGIVKKHQFIEVGEGNKPELILPLTKPDRVSALLDQAGLLKDSFQDGGFTFDDLAHGRSPTGSRSGSAAGGGGSVDVGNEAKDFAELAKQIKSSGKSVGEFVAELELYQEQQQATGTAVSIFADDLISVGEAAALGLTPAQAAAFELQHAANQSQLAAEESAFEFAKLGAVLGEQGVTGEAFQFQMALVAIGDELKESGRSVTEFLRDIAADAVDALDDAFGSLRSLPTREAADVDLELAQKQQERFRKKREGASEDELRAIEETIDGLRERRAELDSNVDVLEAQRVVANQTLLTEEERDFAMALNIIATERQTRAYDELSHSAALEQIARQNLVDAMSIAATAYQANAGVDPFNAQEKAYINAVARQRGEPEPYPGFARGTNYVPRDMAAYLHKGEAVVPAAVNRQLTAGNPAPSFANYGTVNVNVRANSPDQMMRELDRYFRS